MKEKWTLCSYPEKIQLLTLVPDICSQEYCSKCFNVLEYLIPIDIKLQKTSEILDTLAKERKIDTTRKCKSYY